VRSGSEEKKKREGRTNGPALFIPLVDPAQSEEIDTPLQTPESDRVLTTRA